MLRFWVIFLLSVYAIDSSFDASISTPNSEAKRILNALENKSLYQDFADISADQVKKMFNESPELTIYSSFGRGIYYGYWRLNNKQFLRIIALEPLTQKHKKLITAISQDVLHDRELMFSIKSVGGEHKFFKNLSSTLIKSLQGPLRGKFDYPPAQLTTLLMPFDFCASACVALIASLNKYGKAIAFQDESDATCPSTKLYVHSSSISLNLFGDNSLVIKTPKGTRDFNTSMGINKTWYDLNADKFKSSNYTQLNPNSLSGSEIINAVSDDIRMFAKFPTLPIDQVTFSSANDKQLNNVAIAEVFKTKLKASELVNDLENRTVKSNNLDRSRLTNYTQICNSLNPELNDLSELLQYHTSYYNFISEVLLKN